MEWHPSPTADACEEVRQQITDLNSKQTKDESDQQQTCYLASWHVGEGVQGGHTACIAYIVKKRKRRIQVPAEQADIPGP
eukprot:300302-Pelagomonas_calceolata.AAC.1